MGWASLTWMMKNVPYEFQHGRQTVWQKPAQIGSVGGNKHCILHTLIKSKRSVILLRGALSIALLLFLILSPNHENYYTIKLQSLLLLRGRSWKSVHWCCCRILKVQICLLPTQWTWVSLKAFWALVYLWYTSLLVSQQDQMHAGAMYVKRMHQ